MTQNSLKWILNTTFKHNFLQERGRPHALQGDHRQAHCGGRFPIPHHQYVQGEQAVSVKFTQARAFPCSWLLAKKKSEGN